MNMVMDAQYLHRVVHQPGNFRMKLKSVKLVSMYPYQCLFPCSPSQETRNPLMGI